MNLVIDIGNTFVKVALFHLDELTACDFFPLEETRRLESFVGNAEIDACAVSVVAESPQWLNHLTEITRCPILLVNGTISLPFLNRYRTPETLGSDRIAAVAGAQGLTTTGDALIADIGTCVTLDILRGGDTYLGGNISPGPTMRIEALHQGTARLPLVSTSGETPLIGYNTETALRSGVMVGIAKEIEGYFHQLQRDMPALELIITGGKSAAILPLLDGSLPVRHEPHLVEKGLNAILNHHKHLRS